MGQAGETATERSELIPINPLCRTIRGECLRGSLKRTLPTEGTGSDAGPLIYESPRFSEGLGGPELLRIARRATYSPDFLLAGPVVP